MIHYSIASNNKMRSILHHSVQFLNLKSLKQMKVFSSPGLSMKYLKHIFSNHLQNKQLLFNEKISTFTAVWTKTSDRNSKCCQEIPAKIILKYFTKTIRIELSRNSVVSSRFQ